MKKTLMAAVIVVTSLLSISAYTDPTVLAAEGYKAPQMIVKNQNGETLVDLSQLAKDNVVTVLHFWTSTDPHSRMALRNLDNIANTNPGMRLIAVNLDDNQKLFSEIVKLDGINIANQTHVSKQQAPQMVDAYSLNTQMHTFVINSQGVITRIDPSLTQIIHDTL